MSGFFSNLFASQAAAPATTTAAMPSPTGAPAPATQVDTTTVANTNTAINPQNPLDFLMTVSQNTANGQTGQAPSLSIPQETLANVANTIDYSQHIPQEALAALQAGDMSQLGTILNSALRAQYQTIMQHQSAITDKFVSDRSVYDQQNAQSQMRTSIVESSLDINQLHPMAQDMFRSTAKKLAQQYPNASPKDIQDQTWTMMESLGSQFNRTQQNQVAAQKASEVDWDKFGGFTN